MSVKALWPALDAGEQVIVG